MNILPILVSLGLSTFAIPGIDQKPEEPSVIINTFESNRIEKIETPLEKNLPENSKQTRATIVLQGSHGTVPYTFDSDGTLTFGGGRLDESYYNLGDVAEKGSIYDMLGFARASRVEKIVFTQTVRANTRQAGFFGSLMKLKTIQGLEYLDVSQTVHLYDMFYQTPSLESLEGISGWDVKNVTDMTGMFSEMTSLKTLDISNWNTGNVTNMSYMFIYSSSLTSLDLSAWNVGKVTNMQDMFSNMNSLKTLRISNWDTGNVTNMENMFKRDNSLTSLDLSAWNVGKVTNMNSMFYGATSLTSLKLSTWDVGKVTDMSNMFYDVTHLTNLELSRWNTQNVTHMTRMFYSTSSLTTLDLSGWNTEKVTSMYYMFLGNTSLTSLDISGWDTSRLSIATYMFSSVPNLEEITLGKKVKFSSDTDLANPPTSAPYTGRWASIDGPPVVYNNSLTFLRNGTNEDKQTFVWEKKNLIETVTPTVKQLYLKENELADIRYVYGEEFLHNLIVQQAVEKVTYQWLDTNSGLSDFTKDYIPDKTGNLNNHLFQVTRLDNWNSKERIGKVCRMQLTLLHSKANPTGNPAAGLTKDYSFEIEVLVVPDTQRFTKELANLNFGQKTISGAESNTGRLSLNTSVDFEILDLKNIYDTSKGDYQEVSVNTTTGTEKILIGRIDDLALMPPRTNQELPETWKVTAQLQTPFTNAYREALDANLVFHKAKLSPVGANNATAEVSLSKTIHPGAGAVTLLDGTVGGNYQFQKGEHNVFFDKDDIQLEIVNEIPRVGIYTTTLLYVLEDSPNF